MSTYAQIRDARLKDPSTQFWYAQCVRVLEQKDILDVMIGLDDLRQLFIRRYEETTGRKWETS